MSDPDRARVYELWYLSTMGRPALLAVGIVSVVSTVVCYLIARPVPGIGIAMPGLVSPVVAAGLAVLVAPDQASPVAYVAG